jgi:phage-related protein (TIGR01555 family)
MLKIKPRAAGKKTTPKKSGGAPALGLKTNGDGRGTTSQAFDYFRNMAARTGYGTPSLAEATEYTMVRLSYNYWLMLTLYRNHWIARRVVDLPAQDMTRTWCKLTSQLSPDDIQRFDRVVSKTFTPNRIQQALKWSRLFGGAGALICVKGHEKQLEEPLDLDDVNPGTYMGLIPFDRWVGIRPGSELSADFDKPADFGLPTYYDVTPSQTSRSFRVHASRILRFTGPEVPTPEFQAQQYWGISVLEVIYEELRKRDNASWALLNLLFRAQILAQKNPELAQLLSGLGVSCRRCSSTR